MPRFAPARQQVAEVLEARIPYAASIEEARSLGEDVSQARHGGCGVVEEARCATGAGVKKPDDGVVVELKNPGLCCQPKPKGNAPTVPLPAKSRVWVKAVSMGWSGLIVLASIS